MNITSFCVFREHAQFEEISNSAYSVKSAQFHSGYPTNAPSFILRTPRIRTEVLRVFGEGPR